MKILFFFLILKTAIFSQNSVSIEAIPKLIFASYEGHGIIPVGFELQRTNPSFSFGLAFNKKIYRNFNVCLGTNYHINDYYSRYYRDFDSNKKNAFNHNLLRSMYFEPKLLFQLNDFDIFGCSKFYVELGAGYSISRAPVISYFSTMMGENVYGEIDTVTFKITLTPTNNSQFKLLANFGRKFDLGESNFQLGLGLNIRLSQDETRIEREITDNGKFYEFDYSRNSTYIGISLNLSYLSGVSKSTTAKK